MTSDWVHASLIRAIKTAAQASLGIIGSATLLDSVDWQIVVSGGLMAAVLSILTSTAGLPETK